MIDYNSRPVRELLWANEMKEIADVRLFYYHLLLDLHLWSMTDYSVHELRMADGRPVFTGRAASAYNKLLKDCFEISGPAKYVLADIWPEIDKWRDDNEPVKRIPVVSASSGKVLYEAGFRSGFPAMSVLYSLPPATKDEAYNYKVGYGTVKYLPKPYEAKHFYKLYDNEAKRSLDGVLHHSGQGQFAIRVHVSDE
jgi:hypothetical protein